MVADTLHQDMYVYDVYSEYLNKIEHYALNSTINALSVRYYKQNIPMTKGIHDKLDVITTAWYNRAFDIFDFTPVLEMQPLTYQNVNDEQNQGVIRKTQGVLTILAVTEPLPGDILNFYQHGSTNEYFEVKEVNFVHSVKDLNIYQLTFETANWSRSSVEKLNIVEHYYYMKEFRKFYSSELYEDYAGLIENRNNELEIINASYDCIKCRYLDSTLTLTEPKIKKLNETLIYLNTLVKLPIKIIMNYPLDVSTFIPMTEHDTYMPIEGYVAPPYDPSVPYDKWAGQKQSILMKKVYDLQTTYLKFVNYVPPVDGHPHTKKEKVFDEDATQIVRDLNGNSLNA